MSLERNISCAHGPGPLFGSGSRRRFERNIVCINGPGQFFGYGRSATVQLLEPVLFLPRYLLCKRSGTISAPGVSVVFYTHCFICVYGLVFLGTHGI